MEVLMVQEVVTALTGRHLKNLIQSLVSYLIIWNLKTKKHVAEMFNNDFLYKSATPMKLNKEI